MRGVWCVEQRLDRPHHLVVDPVCIVAIVASNNRNGTNGEQQMRFSVKPFCKFEGERT
jgi:hypothetical protein